MNALEWTLSNEELRTVSIDFLIDCATQEFSESSPCKLPTSGKTRVFFRIFTVLSEINWRWPECMATILKVSGSILQRICTCPVCFSNALKWAALLSVQISDSKRFQRLLKSHSIHFSLAASVISGNFSGALVDFWPLQLLAAPGRCSSWLSELLVVETSSHYSSCPQRMLKVIQSQTRLCYKAQTVPMYMPGAETPF